MVVTFTNAAASEMRERILSAIYKKLEETEDEQEIQNLQKQTLLLNKANISTIHSFCLEVIRNNFFEIDISPNFRIADENETILLKQEVLEEFFEEKYEENDEDFQDLVKTYTSYKDDTPLKDLILDIYKYISASPYPRKWLNDAVERFNIEEGTKFEQTEWGSILIQEMKEELMDYIAILSNDAGKLSENIEYKKTVDVLENHIMQLMNLLNNLDDWNKAYNIANAVDFIDWKGGGKNAPKEILDAQIARNKVKERYENVAGKIFVSTSEEAIEDIKTMYNTLLKLKNLVFEYEDNYIAKKKERNIIDFSDVEHYALKILRKEKSNGEMEITDVAKKYQERFEEIAIDEYQDSNLVQEYILTSVSRGNNIFMVGDVKQSIYKFRQARPKLFLEKYKKYSLNEANKYGLIIQLFMNFRSRNNVLYFTNEIFKSIMSEDVGELNYTKEEYLNLGAKWNNEQLKNEIDIIDVQEKEKEYNEENEDDSNESDEIEEEEQIEDIELEAKFVAKKIKNLVESGFQVYDLKEKVKRNINYKDIVILLRSTKERAPIFEKELIENDIPVYSDMSSEYIDSLEIQTILSLLKIIDNPIQDIPLVTVMKSSIGKFTDNDLVQIRLADRNSDFYTALLKAKLSVSDELKEKIEEFLGNLEMWRKEQEYLALDELIWKIYEDTGFLNYMGILPNGALRQANLKMLFERAKQYESASFKGLFNFIKFIERLKTSSGDLGSAKMIGENEDVVRIMSIHKSKGLEFPIVFLANSSKRFNLRDLYKDVLLDQDLGIGAKFIDYEMQLKYDTLTKQALKDRGLVASLSEEMRILYVALTRAKEKIYIIGKSKDFTKQKEEITKMLNIYKKQGEKLNPIMVKKYRSYLDWILIVYFSNIEKMQDLATLNVYKKEDIIKELKNEDKEEMDIIKYLDENSKDVTEKELQNLKNELEFEYEYQEATQIPSKTSITAIANKTVAENREIYTENEENGEEIEKQNQIIFELPKFMKGDEEEKVTASKRGTIIHLCMKNLDFSKPTYQLEDIKKIIEDLQEKSIITQKECMSVNPYQIWNFTKSEIWKELNEAKEYHKEEPFYINVPASDIMNVKCDENILAQGIIDLYYITKNDELVLLDYKTDWVNDGEEDILIKRHTPQLMLYKQALENGLNRKVDKIYIYSTKLGKAIKIM